MDNHTPRPALKITPNRITFYDERTSSHKGTRRTADYYTGTDNSEQSNSREEEARAHNGTLSESGRRNLLKACARFIYFLNISNEAKRRAKIKGKKSLKFITLTLASEQQHSDTEIRQKLLNQFLTELRQEFGLKNYIWKAEKQENGNIHFHILVDIFIDWKIIREKWSRIQNKLGYIDRFRKGINENGFEYYFDSARKKNKFISSETIRARWEKGKKENWNNPPGTEIRRVEKIKNTSAYFAKYFAKEDKIESGFGRIWFASRTVSRYPICRKLQGVAESKLYNFLWKFFKSRAYVNEYCLSYSIDLVKLNRLFPCELLQNYLIECEKYSSEFD